MTTTRAGLRAMAVRASLFAPTSLRDAMEALQFVQYDPIRRPACAQDLILHQRVRRYRNGDLSRAYVGLALEEGYLHVYGAMTQRLAATLDPRSRSLSGDRAYVPAGLARDVLSVVRERGSTHPRDLAVHFGRTPAANDWGGVSAATTAALEELHRHRLIRVLQRDNGVKTYAVSPTPVEAPELPVIVRCLTLHLARSLLPIPLSSLRRTLTQLGRASGIGGAGGAVAGLLRSGELERGGVDGVEYVWPAGTPEMSGSVSRRVRFLAPFDPVVWDRRRFEHLWGWPYRLEAYTPAARRRFGYYALPMFVGDRAVGWVHCGVSEGRLSVIAHFAERLPRGNAFPPAFEHEVRRLAAMLGVTVGSMRFAADSR